jgi:hypothetical protein
MIEPAPETPTHTLWHRPSRRHKWRPVGTPQPSAVRALGLMDGSGLRGGMWMTTTGDRDPNDKPDPDPAPLSDRGLTDAGTTDGPGPDGSLRTTR